jgi:hypothetical protein
MNGVFVQVLVGKEKGDDKREGWRDEDSGGCLGCFVTYKHLCRAGFIALLETVSTRMA